MAEGDTLLNAVIGAVASVVLAFVPFSPVLGGAVAGYLQGGDRSAGLRVGTYAGLIAAIPVVLFVLLFGGIFFLGAVFAPRAAIGVLFVVIVVVVGLVYSVGLSALGGYLGSYLADELDR
ncbi:MAG: DUF5518 domain-containing protein [Halanaeroarchaeum sp.]